MKFSAIFFIVVFSSDSTSAGSFNCKIINAHINTRIAMNVYAACHPKYDEINKDPLLDITMPNLYPNITQLAIDPYSIFFILST